MAVSRLFPVLAVGLTSACATAAAAPPRLADYVVHVEAVSQPADYGTPWQTAGTDEAEGSGVIVAGNRILTAAHVVADATWVEVKRATGTESYPARVEYVGHDCDLAVLRVEDLSFFDGSRPLSIGGLPDLGAPVDVVGFPAGGIRVSVTRGIVSRIEVLDTAQTGFPLLLLQIDAAINSGNSGGPVLADGHVVGIVSASLEEAENVGYVVPSPVIEHFLDDVADGNFDGFPTLGVRIQALENPGHRRALGLGDVDGGIRIAAVGAGGSAAGHLKPGDVLLSVEGYPVARDGTVDVGDGRRVRVSHVVAMKQVGERLTLGVQRNGAPKRVEVELGPERPLVPRRQYDVEPRYFVFGGLVFQPLTENFLNLYESWPSDFAKFTDHGNFQTESRREILVMTQVLHHDVTRGFDDHAGYVLESVNGTPVVDLAQARELAYAQEADLVRFGFEGGGEVVIERHEAERLLPELLEAYGVPAASSEALSSP